MYPSVAYIEFLVRTFKSATSAEQEHCYSLNYAPFRLSIDCSQSQ